MEDVLIYGAGSFGTCLGNHLAKKGHPTLLASSTLQTVDCINKTRQHPKFFSDITLHDNLQVIHEDDLISSKMPETIILAVPTKAIREKCQKFHHELQSSKALVSASKGIEQNTHMTPTKIIASALGNLSSEIENKTVVLSGPSFAIEIMQNMPTCVSIASLNPTIGQMIQSLFHTPNFRCYTSQDPLGLEIAGAMKNIIAIASGACHGLGFGTNSQAALITRGLAEISRVGVALGANPLTFTGLGGVGDLFLTCNSQKSRNFRVGYYLAKGSDLESTKIKIGSTAGGHYTTKSVKSLSDNLKIDAPITNAVFDVIYNSENIHDVVLSLLNRDSKPEM